MEQLMIKDQGELNIRHHWQLSESNERFTPAPIVDIFRRTAGSIALDPASNSLSNSWVKADTFFDKEANGLNRDWSGPLWSNFPYGWDTSTGTRRSSVDVWSEKLFIELVLGHVKEAATLIGSRHLNLESIQSLINAVAGPTAVLHFKDRIEFLRLPENRIGTIDHIAQMEVMGQPTGNNALIYVGPNLGRFIWFGQKWGSVHVSAQTLLRYPESMEVIRRQTWEAAREEHEEKYGQEGFTES